MSVIGRSVTPDNIHHLAGIRILWCADILQGIAYDLAGKVDASEFTQLLVLSAELERVSQSVQKVADGDGG